MRTETIKHLQELFCTPNFVYKIESLPADMLLFSVQDMRSGESLIITSSHETVYELASSWLIDKILGKKEG